MKNENKEALSMILILIVGGVLVALFKWFALGVGIAALIIQVEEILRVQPKPKVKK